MWNHSFITTLKKKIKKSFLKPNTQQNKIEKRRKKKVTPKSEIMREYCQEMLKTNLSDPDRVSHQPSAFIKFYYNN